MLPEGSGKLKKKKFIHLNGSRVRDLPPCIIVFSHLIEYRDKFTLPIPYVQMHLYIKVLFSRERLDFRLSSESITGLELATLRHVA
jgi:hypothetical protein